MLEERELVGLLYRADWTRLALSGTVTGAEPVVEADISFQSDEPLTGPWQRQDYDPSPPPPLPSSGLLGHVPPSVFERVHARGAERAQAAGRRTWVFAPGGAGAGCALSVAPGRRFLAEDTEETWAVGCDGARLWHWLRDRPAGSTVGFGSTGTDDRPRPPYRTLLVPSWLLTGYALVLDGEVTVSGRAGVRVLGTPREVAAARAHPFGGQLGPSASGGALFGLIPRSLTAPRWNEVEAVVDVELGILLRCSKRAGDKPPSVTAFSSLDVGGTAGASRFRAPAGSVFVGDKGSSTRDPGDRATDGAAGASLGDAVGEALGTAGKEAAKTVAGLAAGGLGALIRYSPRGRRVDPFTRAAAEAADPEAEMPTDEPAPDKAADGAAPALADEALADEALADEALHLVYRSGLAAPSLRATLHQWTDFDAVYAAVPPSAQDKGFGGVGFLIDALRASAREATTGDHHAVRTVAIGGWNEYRIDVVRSVADASLYPASRSVKHDALTIASDGVRQWQVYRDRVMTGTAAPPPSELADLLDPAWLLDSDLELSGGAEVRAGGRRAYRIEVRYREAVPFGIGTGWWPRLFFPAVAVVDAETGRVLRLTRFKGGRPTMRQELRDLAELDADADFAFTPPAGLPTG